MAEIAKRSGPAEAPKAPKPAEKPSEDAKPTRRVVLRRMQVVELPSDSGGRTWEEIGAAVAKMLKGGKGVTEAWHVCGEFEGSKSGAIEAFAGKPGTADAKPGLYRAPSVTAWKGGEDYVKPPEPLIERKRVD